MSQISVVVDVDDARDLARIDQLFHRLAADARGVEDEAVVVVAERRADLADALGGHAEHGEPDGRAWPRGAVLRHGGP
jgi:hypothetical protein